jgi:hypothetical protein
MDNASSDVSDLHLREFYGSLTRLTFIVAGVAIIALVLVELGRALWPLGWWSPWFAVILVGACLIGASLIAAGIFGDDVAWTLRDAELRLDRRSLWRSKTEIIRGDDVAAMSESESVWDSGPNTWRVAIRLRTGRTILTPPLDSSVRAEELLKQIHSQLSRDC